MQHREGVLVLLELPRAPRSGGTYPSAGARPMCIDPAAGGDRRRIAGGVARSAGPRGTFYPFVRGLRGLSCRKGARSREYAPGSPRAILRRGLSRRRIISMLTSGSGMSRLALVRARSTKPFSLGQKQVQRDLGRVRMNFAASNFADTICVCSQLLHDVSVRMTFVCHDVNSNGLLPRKLFAFYCDFVQRHAGEGVFRNCHEGDPPCGDVAHRFCENPWAGGPAHYRGAVTLAGSGVLQTRARSGDPDYHNIQCQSPPCFIPLIAQETVYSRADVLTSPPSQSDLVAKGFPDLFSAVGRYR